MTDLRNADRNTRRAAKAYLERERLKWPVELAPVPPDQWPTSVGGRKMPVEIWRSRDFLLQVFHESEAIERLSVNRTEIGRGGHWREDITWEDLQALKRQCGRGDLDAVEIYPRDADVVNVANMRHLWVLKFGAIAFAWRKLPEAEIGAIEEKAKAIAGHWKRLGMLPVATAWHLRLTADVRYWKRAYDDLADHLHAAIEAREAAQGEIERLRKALLSIETASCEEWAAQTARHALSDEALEDPC